MKIFAVLCVSLAWLAFSHDAAAEPRAFVAIETANVETSQAWYRNVFDAEVVNSFSEPAYEQRILRGPDIIVELIQHKPHFDARVGDRQGLIKSGVVIDDFAARIERWRTLGVTMHGRQIHDDALDLDTILLSDPDGNFIQVFGAAED